MKKTKFKYKSLFPTQEFFYVTRNSSWTQKGVIAAIVTAVCSEGANLPITFDELKKIMGRDLPVASGGDKQMILRAIDYLNEEGTLLDLCVELHKISANAYQRRLDKMAAWRKSKADKRIEQGTPVADKYKFEGKVCKLIEKDYLSWKKAFNNLDLDNELVIRDNWLVEQDEKTRKNWYISTYRYFEGKNKRFSGQTPLIAELKEDSNIIKLPNGTIQYGSYE